MLICATALADAPPGWLNVKDFGASGSEYSTTASTVKGSKQITVKDVGDFKAGQGVMLSKCTPRITKQQLWGPRGVVVMGRRLDGKAEIRGYDGSQGDWVVLVLDVAKGSATFRWSEDLARTWHPTVPITGDWQPIRDGIEVRFNKFEWEKGYTVVFAGRGQLVTVIEKIEGNTITLRHVPTRTVKDAELRHCDDAALQAAINQAVKEKRNLFVPIGRYRLSRGLRVAKPEGLTIEGENAVHTILDISEGNGACVTMVRGTEITLRNFTMVGHSGFDRRDQCGHIPMKGSSYFWGFGAKNCNATTISGTERVLIENCHGRRMASECFVSGCRSRSALKKPNTTYTKTTTYLRCSAIDCGRNAFNDVTSGPENTSVLYCRIVDVGGCAWEGASRFVKFVGNYVRNAGTVAMGNLGTYNRDETFPELGAGQHIIANNVFESNVPYGRCAIRSAVGSTQVIIANNLFVNFGSSAVETSGRSDPTHYASANTTITGNIFDMTEIGEKSVPRTAINVSASDTTISDNQVYVRGAADPRVTAIMIKEPAVNVTVHDNLIRNCGTGIITGRAASRVGEVMDTVTFAPSFTFVPLDWRRARQCQGWRLVWLAGGRPSGVSVLDAVVGAAKPETVQFKLKEPRQMKPGDLFDTIPPSANWLIHNNTITGCLRPVALNRYGSRTSIFRGNIVNRGGTQGVAEAVVVGGEYRLIDNHISGFDEKDAAAFVLRASHPGLSPRMVFQGNIVQRCSNAVKAEEKRLWEEAIKEGNQFINCETIHE
ncbi:MAG: right-handed parallel beta-helix repeat-containing protein [Planctomycetes bacterium]|nr:right-handed parallel beta-helix repeat-containing protein [Planctomycetota bacterium]